MADRPTLTLPQRGAQPAPASPEPQPERRFRVTVALADDGEPRDIFVGANGQDFRITRGKPVVVPERVLNALGDAVKGVPERDENDPDKVNYVMRQRFAYTVHEEVRA